MSATERSETNILNRNVTVGPIYVNRSQSHACAPHLPEIDDFQPLEQVPSTAVNNMLRAPVEHVLLEIL